MARKIRKYRITAHAADEMQRRGISQVLLESVLAAPEQSLTLRPGRDVLQSQFEIGGRTYLLRVFVDIDRDPAEVVTVYRTTKIAKYWRSHP